jgi:hypothetical protein
LELCPSLEARAATQHPGGQSPCTQDAHMPKIELTRPSNSSCEHSATSPLPSICRNRLVNNAWGWKRKRGIAVIESAAVHKGSRAKHVRAVGTPRANRVRDSIAVTRWRRRRVAMPLKQCRRDWFVSRRSASFERRAHLYCIWLTCGFSNSRCDEFRYLCVIESEMAHTADAPLPAAPDYWQPTGASGVKRGNSKTNNKENV